MIPLDDANIERVSRLICRAEGHDPDTNLTTAIGFPERWVTIPLWSDEDQKRKAGKLIIKANLFAEAMALPEIAPLIVALRMIQKTLEE